MKSFLTILAIVFSANSFAFNNEVECQGVLINGEQIHIEIERSLGGGLRDGRVTIFGARGTNPRQTRHLIYQARRFGYMIQYTGDFGFNLQVDIFPDQFPRWARYYRGSFNLERNLTCRFPNAQ
jgi:hypothetical protein